MTSQTSVVDASADRPVQPLPGRLDSLHKISWGSIVAGVVVALVAQLLLSILGSGIGLARVDPSSSGTLSATTLSIGAAVWWVLSGVLASAIGGLLAGRLSGKASPMTAGHHGLVTWSVTTLVVAFLLSSTVGGILGGAFGAVTNTLGGAGHLIGGAVQTAAQAAAPSLPGTGDPLSGIESQIKSASGGQDPAQLRVMAANAVKAALTGDPSQQQQATDRAAEAPAKAQGIPADQAKAQVQQYQKQYSDAIAQAQVEAIEIADASAKATSKAAMMIVISLVLGAIAAFVGGRVGTVRSSASAFDR